MCLQTAEGTSKDFWRTSAGGFVSRDVKAVDANCALAPPISVIFSHPRTGDHSVSASLSLRSACFHPCVAAGLDVRWSHGGHPLLQGRTHLQEVRPLQSSRRGQPGQGESLARSVHAVNLLGLCRIKKVKRGNHYECVCVCVCRMASFLSLFNITSGEL